MISNFAFNSSQARYLIVIALSICLLFAGLSLKAEESDLLDNITYGLDGLSFPEDILIEAIESEPGQYRVFDQNLRLAKVNEIVVREAELPGIRSTIDLARYHRSMVVLENDVKNTLQIAVLRVLPQQIEFRVIDTNPRGLTSFLQEKTGFIEIWYRQSDQTEEVFVGTTCRGCSSRELSDLKEELDRVRQREIDLEHGLVEINISFSGLDVLYPGTRSRYRAYNPQEVALLPIFETGSGEFLGVRLIKIKKDLGVNPDSITEVNLHENLLQPEDPANTALESPLAQRGLVFTNARRNQDGDIVFDSFNLMEWEEALPEDDNALDYIGEIATVAGTRSTRLVELDFLDEEVIRLFQAQQIFYSYGKVLSEAKERQVSVIANWQRARIPQLFLKIPGPNDPYYESNLPPGAQGEDGPL